MKNFVTYSTGCVLIFVGLVLLLSRSVIFAVLGALYFLALHFIGLRYYKPFWARFWRICVRFGTIR